MDKLCLRYKNCDDERLWRDITYCLSLLPFKSEKSFRKLLEYMPLYQDKLHEETVYKLFTDIIAKVQSKLRCPITSVEIATTST
jgi:condensin complex subunit 1